MSYTIDYTTFAVSGEVERSSAGLTTPLGLTAVTPTERPNSARNRCVIEFLVAFFYVVTVLFFIFLWV